MSANEKWQLASGIGLGYMSYTDKGWINFGMPGSNTITGASLGTLIETGIDYKIVKGLSAGLNLNLYGGSLSKINHNGTSVKLDSKNKESLSRIEGVAGLRYNFLNLFSFFARARKCLYTLSFKHFLKPKASSAAIHIRGI